LRQYCQTLSTRFSIKDLLKIFFWKEKKENKKKEKKQGKHYQLKVFGGENLKFH